MNIFSSCATKIKSIGVNAKYLVNTHTVGGFISVYTRKECLYFSHKKGGLTESFCVNYENI